MAGEAIETLFDQATSVVSSTVGFILGVVRNTGQSALNMVGNKGFIGISTLVMIIFTLESAVGRLLIEEPFLIRLLSESGSTDLYTVWLIIVASTLLMSFSDMAKIFKETCKLANETNR